MPTAPYKWTKNDSITATRLNTVTDAVVELQRRIGGDETASSNPAQNYTDNEAPQQEEPEHAQYDGDTKVWWRHPFWGTSDLTGSDSSSGIGFYAAPPRVQRADGTEGLNPEWNSCAAAPCKLTVPAGTEEGTNKDVVYLKVITGPTGSPIAPAEYTFCVKPDKNLYHLKGGNGTLYFPIAKLIDNPQFPCEKFAMNSNAVSLPIVAADASYCPCYPAGSRQPQGMAIADALQQAVVPIEGINNHGGVKILDADVSGLLSSQAVMASIEMYGVAPGTQKDGDPDKTYYYSYYTPGPAGSDPVLHEGWLYEEYNYCTPYKNNEDGLLARWKVKTLCHGCQYLKLKASHLEDWQLAFEAEGCLDLTEGRTAPGTVKKTTTTPSSGGVTKSIISIYSASGKNYLLVQNYCQQICFGSTETNCAVNIYTSFNGWQAAGTQKIELPGGGGSSFTPCVEVYTTPGTPAPGCTTRWIDSTLRLVQEPVYWICCGSPTDRITGYRLV